MRARAAVVGAVAAAVVAAVVVVVQEAEWRRLRSTSTVAPVPWPVSVCAFFARRALQCSAECRA